MRALNNALGRHVFEPDDLSRACANMLEEDWERGDTRDMHEGRGGWYSSEVLAHALNFVWMDRFDHVEYELRLRTLHVDPAQADAENFVGALQNRSNRHWVAIRREAGGALWLLDSLHEPQPLSYAMFRSLIARFPATYPLFRI